MCDIKICRICLIQDAKLFKLEQFNLKYYYQEIMQNKILSKDQLPHWFCFECAALLHKYHKFKEKCTYGQNTLNNLLCKGYMNYEVIEDIRKNRNDLSLNYIIPNKNIKTYLVKHKKEIAPSQIENILLTEERLKDENPETDDEDCTLYKLKHNKSLKDESPEPDDISNFDDDFDLGFNIEKTADYTQIELENSKSNLDNHELGNTHQVNENDIKTDLNDIKNHTIDIAPDTEQKILEDLNDKSTLLFSLLSERPSRVKRSKDVEDSKPRKFEKKKRTRINKDNWEIKILSEDEALEQFQQRMYSNRYIKFHYKCTKCFKAFSKNDILLRHNKQCHDVGSFECRFCHMLFKRKYQLGRHMVVHYYVYQCLRCDLKCNLLSTAAFHEDSHNGVLRTCKHCGENFKHVSTYYTHLRKSHRNSHSCKLCGVSFVSEMGLDFHMKRQHCMEQEDHSSPTCNIYCERCNVEFVSQQAFDEHLSQSKLHEDDQPLKKRSRKESIEHATTCRFCKAKFTTRAECRKHFALEHRGDKGSDKPPQHRVMCEICGAWLAASSIEVHMNRHTKKKVFPCQFCGKEFLCKSGYNTHQKKHTGIRPHACKICHKRFSQKFAMEIHYRRVHLKEPYPKRNRRKNTDEVPLFEKMKWH